jgi:hypothetical protein
MKRYNYTGKSHFWRNILHRIYSGNSLLENLSAIFLSSDTETPASETEFFTLQNYFVSTSGFTFKTKEMFMDTSLRDTYTMQNGYAYNAKRYVYNAKRYAYNAEWIRIQCKKIRIQRIKIRIQYRMDAHTMQKDTHTMQKDTYTMQKDTHTSPMFLSVLSRVPLSSSKTSASLYVIPTISCTLPAITIIFPVPA